MRLYNNKYFIQTNDTEICNVNKPVETKRYCLLKSENI